MVARWKQNLGLGVLATIGTYIVLFTWSSIQTTYDEHHDATGRWQSVVKEKDQLKQGLSDRDAYIKIIEAKTCPNCSTRQSSQVVNRIVEEPQRCWMTNHAESPPSARKDILSATTVIIHCNHRIEAPFVVQLEFEKDNYLGGSTAFLPDEGITTFGAGLKQGRTMITTVGSPSLPVQSLVTVFILGTTDQAPKAIRYAIGSK